MKILSDLNEMWNKHCKKIYTFSKTYKHTIVKKNLHGYVEHNVYEVI